MGDLKSTECFRIYHLELPAQMSSRTQIPDKLNHCLAALTIFWQDFEAVHVNENAVFKWHGGTSKLVG